MSSSSLLPSTVRYSICKVESFGRVPTVIHRNYILYLLVNFASVLPEGRSIVSLLDILKSLVLFQSSFMSEATTKREDISALLLWLAFRSPVDRCSKRKRV
jgi:hypothetical protein